MEELTIKTSRSYAFWCFKTIKFWFPDKMTLNQNGISTVKRKSVILFWIKENEQIPYARIASVRHIRGMFWDSIILESSGGSNTLDVIGLRKRDAKTLAEKINAEIAMK
ncbi:MAG: hypothetical protein AB1656_04885 [Candidatus Omnitrophota bacterium]